MPWTQLALALVAACMAYAAGLAFSVLTMER